MKIFSDACAVFMAENPNQPGTPSFEAMEKRQSIADEIAETPELDRLTEQMLQEIVVAALGSGADVGAKLELCLRKMFVYGVYVGMEMEKP